MITTYGMFLALGDSLWLFLSFVLFATDSPVYQCLVE
jgi:hypothetical protein